MADASMWSGLRRLVGLDAAPPDPEEAALLRGVLDAPDDDAPRLVYADWLDEHGRSERAVFIRVQCALAGLPEGDPSRPALAAREAELRQRHGAAWSRPVRWRASEPVFRRGFVDAVTLDALAAATALPRIRANEPLREITLTASGPVTQGWSAVFRSSVLAGLRGLTLRMWLSDDEVADLAASAALAGLRRFGIIGGAPLQRQTIDAISAFSHLRGVRELTLRRVFHTPAHVEEVFPFLNWPLLESLDLAENRTGAAEYLLANWSGLNRLRHLDLSGGAPLIMWPPGTADWADVSQDDLPVEPPSLCEFLASPALGNLESLALRSRRLGPKEALDLAALANLGRLTRLDLRDNPELMMGFPRGRQVRAEARAALLRRFGAAVVWK
jgi:uncharacterized protein (TIGR02996 family)